MPGLTEQTGQEGYQGDADQSDAAASHQLLHALRLGTGIIVAVAFEQVDNAPDCQTSTQSNDQSLKNTNCRVKECHIKFTAESKGCLRIDHYAWLSALLSKIHLD